MSEPKYTPEFLKEVKTLLDTPVENYKKIIKQWEELVTTNPSMFMQAWEELGLRAHISDAIDVNSKWEPPTVHPVPREEFRPEELYDEYVEKIQQKKDK